MAAPKGNKYAVGNQGGRPRERDLVEEAKLFKEWADTDDALVLREFACIRDYSCQEDMHKYAAMSDEFRQAFNYARMKIGARREKMLAQGKGHPAPFMRYAALYDKELKTHEIDMKNQDPGIKAQQKVASDLETIVKALQTKSDDKA